MTSIEYKLAYQKSGYTKAKWIELLGISPSIHQNYSSGRGDIPNWVEDEILDIIDIAICPAETKIRMVKCPVCGEDFDPRLPYIHIKNKHAKDSDYKLSLIRDARRGKVK